MNTIHYFTTNVEPIISRQLYTRHMTFTIHSLSNLIIFTAVFFVFQQDDETPIYYHLHSSLPFIARLSQRQSCQIFSILCYPQPRFSSYLDQSCVSTEPNHTTTSITPDKPSPSLRDVLSVPRLCVAIALRVIPTVLHTVSLVFGRRRPPLRVTSALPWADSPLQWQAKYRESQFTLSFSFPFPISPVTSTIMPLPGRACIIDMHARLQIILHQSWDQGVTSVSVGQRVKLQRIHIIHTYTTWIVQYVDPYTAIIPTVRHVCRTKVCSFLVSASSY